MAPEYNSLLISRLYASSDFKATEIADEMVEIGDMVFVRPIFDAYKKFENYSFSHYFLSDLARFSSPEASEIFKEIALDYKTKDGNFLWTLDYLREIGFTNPYIVSKAESIFYEKLNSKNISGYDLDAIFRYLNLSGSFKKHEQSIISIFEDEKLAMDTRSSALNILLEVDARGILKFYLDNYVGIKNKQAEIIFAKTIASWHGGTINLLKEKIIKEGSSRAKELIKEAEKEEVKKENDREVQAEVKHTNAQIVSDIAELRNNINIFTQGDENFGFPIFNESEILYRQSRGAGDLATLKGFSVDLRDFLHDLSPKLSDNGFGVEEAREIIGGIKEETLKLPLNRLHLFLKSKGKQVDDNLCGIRPLNELLNKLAHPKNEEELVVALKKNDIFELYKSNSWQKLHKKILELYLDFLKKIYGLLR